MVTLEKIISKIAFFGACASSILGLGNTAFSREQNDWIYNPQNNHEYRLSSRGLWSETLAEAKTEGGYLVTINNAQENQWLVDNFNNKENIFWIGLNYVNNQWGWENGEPFIFDKWDIGEPNHLDYEFVAYIRGINNSNNRSAGTWNNVAEGPPSYPKVPGIIERIVLQPTPTPSIKLVSPNGGEVLKEKNFIDVHWKTQNLPDRTGVGYELWNRNGI
ncbi:MAG: lectin-like protein, partial [Nanoarchaeota archaeon]